MLFRQAALVILAGVLPLAAAGTLAPGTRAWFRRVTGWMLALIFYKPAAAAVYATAFTMIGKGKDPRTILMGFATVLLSLLALPVLMKFFTWTTGVCGGRGRRRRFPRHDAERRDRGRRLARFGRRIRGRVRSRSGTPGVGAAWPAGRQQPAECWVPARLRHPRHGHRCLSSCRWRSGAQRRIGVGVRRRRAGRPSRTVWHGENGDGSTWSGRGGGERRGSGCLELTSRGRGRCRRRRRGRCGRSRCRACRSSGCRACSRRDAGRPPGSGRDAARGDGGLRHAPGTGRSAARLWRLAPSSRHRPLGSWCCRDVHGAHRGRDADPGRRGRRESAGVRGAAR